jgi:hypothetical protein
MGAPAPRAILTAFWVIVLAITGHDARAQSPVLELGRGRVSNLASRPEWLRLVHFGTTTFGRLESEVDDPRFFLSATGKTDPEAELVGTLHAFQAPMVRGHEDQHALCRFPARRRWLDQELHFLARPPPCPRLDARNAKGHVTLVSFVYASNYVGNPASAFGHSFLHIHVEATDGASRTGALDVGADFRAVTTTKNPLAYAFMGMTGMFAGRVEVVPYDQVVVRYAVKEARDLWEYDLALTEEEREMLWLHLWEMEPTELDYFYLGRNCSYESLRLLEVAAPRLSLITEVKALAFPLDTLHAITKNPGLVLRVEYRASTEHAREERRWLRPPVPLSKDPSLGHGPMRFAFGSGATSQYGTGFVTIGFRIGLHELTDPPDGWASLSAVEVLDARLRFDMDRRDLTVDRMTFVDLTGLHPVQFEPRVSWRIRAFGERLHDGNCSDCFAHGLDGSVGGALATQDRRVAVFAMADAYAEFVPHSSGIDDSFLRLGGGPYAGARVQAGPLVALVTGTISYLPWERVKDSYHLRLEVKGALARGLALGVEADAQPESVEAALVSYVYF